MIRNVLKPDGTAHIEQQVGNMRYDLTTRQVDTVVPGAGATNLVFGADGRPHVELTTGSIRQDLGRPGHRMRNGIERGRGAYSSTASPAPHIAPWRTRRSIPSCASAA